MAHLTDETVFNVNAECIVNTVNCVGVMGRGLALEFSLRFPELNKKYVEQCERGEIKVGHTYFYNNFSPKVINFPMKKDFKNPSNLTWIEWGLIDFVRHYKEHNIKYIAFTYLGCANGGLDKKLYCT